MKPDDDDFRIGVPGVGVASQNRGLTPPARQLSGSVDKEG